MEKNANKHIIYDDYSVSNVSYHTRSSIENNDGIRASKYSQRRILATAPVCVCPTILSNQYSIQ